MSRNLGGRMSYNLGSPMMLVRALMLLLVLAAPGSAQEQGTTLTGVVRDATSQAAVRGALVAIGDRGPRALTDSLGAFRLTGVPSGRQALRVQRYGYQTLHMVLDEAGRATPLELRLAPDPLQL